MRVIHLPRYGSDHSAIRIDLKAESMQKERKKRYQFKFEENWSWDLKCGEVINRICKASLRHTVAKLAEMKSLSDHFREYRTRAVRKELNRIETLLKEDSNWEVSEEYIKRYRCL